MTEVHIKDTYEAVIGLEVHAQLLTESKAYSNDRNTYGEAPNTLISPITLGHPGTLPRMNKETIQCAIKLGLACGSTIAPLQHFARKNYFYPDLPKGYQITQDTTPICTGGEVLIKDENGHDKTIGITRIHMEEDAGKSIHDVDVFDTLVDLNRAGVPLLEIVSEPDLRSSKQAYNYLTEIRKLVRYLSICDGNMEEGSLRCDANISVRKKGVSEFGVKVEVKNMNSIRNVQRAIEFEINRQVECIEKGELVQPETRGFDALKGVTISMRSKEAANDYRYFPEPDLLPIVVTKEQIEHIKAHMPTLPRELFLTYTQQFHLSSYDAGILTENKSIALFYDSIIQHTKNYKAAANWVIGEVKSYLNEFGVEMDRFPIEPLKIAQIIHLIEEQKISHSAASQKLFPALIQSPHTDPLQLAENLNILQESSDDDLQKYIDQVFNDHPAELTRYRNGEKQLIGFFMGQLMKASKGKADPKKANDILRKQLDEA
jgi:aspartyl-tRNA(Asn)/glutamyl-tRNA(Gln) amidotransferase subunit B